MTVAQHHAAWIDAVHAPLGLREAPWTDPGADQVVVRNHAVAVNPVDWVIQVAGGVAYRWLTYPTVLGSDLAGEVVAVGADVTHLRVGDRVLGHAVGTDKDANRPAEGAFQEYSVVLERLTCPIPDGLSYERACVLPLAVSTAACGLFQGDFLGLLRPSLTPRPTGKTVLVWGGSTSVGSQAVQLAVAAGYEVVATAGPRNADYVRSLGASQVFDRNAATVIDDIVAACNEKDMAGAIAFGDTSGDACIRIISRCRGRKFVALASPPVSFAPLGEPDTGRLATAGLMARAASGMARQMLWARTHRVGCKVIYGTTLKSNDIADAIYRDFLPAALANGQYTAAPEPRVIGVGLGHLQEALDLQRRGVSAAKLVVTLAASRPATH